MITGLYAGILALLLLALSTLVIMARWKNRVALGSGESKEMLRVMRGHANFIEYVPISLILMLILELSHANAWLLYIMGNMMVLGRIIHAAHFFFGQKHLKVRQIGMILTFLPLLIGGIACMIFFI